ncbi:hypothetical protein ABLU65_00510 [Klebsiella sp. GG_Kp156]|uniref:hypothetical protein n=1 Tax=Klebsiella sp. GG_Kp156 TaxID=3153467 RepID=UPI0032B44166
MTKSTITRERAQQIFLGNGPEPSASEERELARMALAVMDSEPVENHIGSKNALDAIVSFIKSKSNPTVKCYEGVSEQLFKDNCHGIHSHVIEYILKLGKELEDLRAEQAEIQPAPVVPDDVLDALQKVARIRLDMNDFDGDRRGIADCLCDAEEALIEVVNRRAAMLNGGRP